VSPYLRQVKTVSGATAVQVVAKDHGVRRIVEHLGSARPWTSPRPVPEGRRHRHGEEEAR